MVTAPPLLDVVLFDLDDTLYSTTAFAEKARRHAVHAMIEAGLDLDEKLVLRELSEVVTEFRSNYAGHFDRLLDRLGRECIGDRNPAVVIAAGVVAYHRTKETDMRLLPDARRLLEALHEAGVRTGVLSDGLQVKQAEKLLRLGVLRFIDPAAIFFSDQLGISKPNPKIFVKACEALGVGPGRVLYIGDRSTHDVAPAAAAGLKTVLYRGAGGKYVGDQPACTADHDVSDLGELLPVLRERYGLPV
jgi:putative hydrolase of the HAD superfamily